MWPAGRTKQIASEDPPRSTIWDAKWINVWYSQVWCLKLLWSDTLSTVLEVSWYSQLHRICQQNEGYFGSKQHFNCLVHGDIFSQVIQMFKHGMNEFDTECRHGTWVASHPVATILASVAVCGVFALGLINFHQETNMVRLWLPQVKEQTETSFYNVCRTQILCNTWLGCGSRALQTRDTGGDA